MTDDGTAQYGVTQMVPITQWNDGPIRAYLREDIHRQLIQAARRHGHELYTDPEYTETPVREVVTQRLGAIWTSHDKCAPTSATHVNIAAYAWAF